MVYPPSPAPEPADVGPTDPATTRLPHARYDDPRHNPIAFLPVAPREVEPIVVPPRLDDWCEDRQPGELTDDDGVD